MVVVVVVVCVCVCVCVTSATNINKQQRDAATYHASSAKNNTRRTVCTHTNLQVSSATTTCTGAHTCLNDKLLLVATHALHSTPYAACQRASVLSAAEWVSDEESLPKLRWSRQMVLESMIQPPRIGVCGTAWCAIEQRP